MRLGEFADLASLSSVDGDTAISGITSDSRAVKPGDIFAALKGQQLDGAEFASDAVEKGACAILAAPGLIPDELGVPVLEAEDPRHALAIIAARLNPGQPETLVAVTGTAGKTSVAAFTRQIWAHAGLRAASIGTTGVVAPGIDEYGSLTTPDPVKLHELLGNLNSLGVTHAAMEASSHGLEQRRLDGVRLAAAGFTNLGHDHLDYHPTMEEYHRAKMRLFDTLLPEGAPAIVFADDQWSAKTFKAVKAAGRELLTVGRSGSFLNLKRVEHERSKQHAQIEFEGTIHEVELPLAGDFQIANALVSAGLAISTGTAAETAFEALEKLEGAPGRLDLVGMTAAGAPVYVDYAHKPEALENVLAAVRPFTLGRIVVVFGCGGDRDRKKRPVMGEIATRLADVVIVTDDNPRTETPSDIRAEIMKAAPGAEEIGDRREAISHAVGMLKSGDTLIVAGKGHEEGQTIGNKTLPFSDHAVIREFLSEDAA